VHQHLRLTAQTAAGRVGEQQRRFRVPANVVRLLRQADRRGDHERAFVVPVQRDRGPRDRCTAAADGCELAGPILPDTSGASRAASITVDRPPQSTSAIAPHTEGPRA
jgi:hypothetical protein